MEQLKAMFEAMEKDAVLREEILALIKSGNASEIMKLAAKKGFVFTEADWQAYIDWSKTLPANSHSKELSVEELDKISGGHEAVYFNDCGCWFHAASEPEFRDGAMRRKCNQICCSIWPFICECWVTPECVGAWHVPPGSTSKNCG